MKHLLNLFSIALLVFSTTFYFRTVHPLLKRILSQLHPNNLSADHFQALLKMQMGRLTGLYQEIGNPLY